MSSTNGDGKGNLLISYLFKRDSLVKQVAEEAELKVLINQLLVNKGYKFSLCDDKIIDQRLLGSSWIEINERYPTREEYLKNDGRFIVTDGNRVYQSLFDIYEKNCFMYITHNFEEIIDNCVIAWQLMPEPYRAK